MSEVGVASETNVFTLYNVDQKRNPCKQDLFLHDEVQNKGLFGGKMVALTGAPRRSLRDMR
eukprot:237806-Amphidinium_carterae.1